MKALLTVVLTAFLLPALATISTACRAESEAMQRERALNRILVAERHEREHEAAARGNGLAGIKPAATTPAKATKPPQEPSRRQPSRRAKQAPPT